MKIKLWMWNSGDRQLHNMPSPVNIHTEYRALPMADFRRMEKLAAMKWAELEEEKTLLVGVRDAMDDAECCYAYDRYRRFFDKDHPEVADFNGGPHGMALNSATFNDTGHARLAELEGLLE